MAFFRRLRPTAACWLNEHSGFWLYAAVLLFCMAAAYESQVWRMGTYYDDWEGIFMYKQGFSPAQIWSYFLRDRPFSFLVHVAYNPIFRASALGWHIWGLVLNWAAVLLLVKTLLELWPKRVTEAGWIGLLIALYPGMHRQFVVHTSMPHYTSMLLFTLSLLLMVKAYRRPSRRGWLLAISIALAALQVLIIEYFAALEVVRLLLLYQLFRTPADDWRQTARRALLAWLPYAVVFVGFLVFHFAVLPAIQFQGVAPKNSVLLLDQLKQQPLATLVQYAQNVLQDVLYSVFYVWATPWVPQDLALESRLVLASWLLGLLAAVAAVLVMLSWQRRAGESEIFEPAALPPLTGLSALLLGGIPAWIIGVQAVKGRWADRYLFGQIMGAVPLAVLGIVWLTGQRRRLVQNIAFAVLLAGSVSMQVRVGDEYVSFWNRTRDYYWQLKWRAPSFEPGMFLVTTSTPVGGTDSYQNGLVVNTAFNSGYGKEEVLYWWFSGPEDLYVHSENRYRPASPIIMNYRSLSFHSDMKHAMPVIQDKSGSRCVQILDRAYDGEPMLDDAEHALFPIAHPEVVQLKEKPLPLDVFGPEPPHAWCYFFQKADLARQYKQWDQVLQLWKEAGSLSSTSKYGPELMPFIEAFANTGKWKEASDLTIEANTRTIDMPPFLCGTWARIIQETPASSDQAASWAKVKEALSCQGSE